MNRRNELEVSYYQINNNTLLITVFIHQGGQDELSEYCN